MAPDHSNCSNLEQLALKGLKRVTHRIIVEVVGLGSVDDKPSIHHLLVGRRSAKPAMYYYSIGFLSVGRAARRQRRRAGHLAASCWAPLAVRRPLIDLSTATDGAAPTRTPRVAVDTAAITVTTPFYEKLYPTETGHSPVLTKNKGVTIGPRKQEALLVQRNRATRYVS